MAENNAPPWLDLRFLVMIGTAAAGFIGTIAVSNENGRRLEIEVDRLSDRVLSLEVAVGKLTVRTEYLDDIVIELRRQSGLRTLK
jgi:hypothetical protein